MDVLLNGIKLDITLEDEKNIGDILRAMETELDKNAATIIEVCADGTIISAEMLDKLFDQPIDSVNELSIKSISALEVSNIIREVCSHFNALADKLEELPVQLQKNEDKKAMETVTELADSLSLLFQTIPYVNLFPEKFSDLTVESEPLAPFVEQFPALMQDFLSAVESNDTVSIGDLAEYEISPKLRQLASLKDSL
ncbi:MAG: hypothetical protein MJ196_03505 [Treponemataceae bacterium]|nr:hypothetical protein [Treponemataceae bacterium]